MVCIAMRRIRFLLVSVILVTLTVGVNTAAPPHVSAASTAAARSWTADNGNGTCSNPLFYMDRLDLGPAFRLEGGTIHGRVIWAPCIRYHDGMFYLFSNVNNVGCQVFRSKSHNGPRSPSVQLATLRMLI